MISDYKLSAFSDEYSDSLVEQCEVLSRLGIGSMEMRGVNGKNVSVLTKSEVASAKKILSDFGISVSAIGSPIGKVVLGEKLDEHTEMAKRVFDTALELGAKNIRVFSFYPPKGKAPDDVRPEVFDELSRLLDIADSFGVTLCHENEANIFGESPARCLELARVFSGRLKLVFDMGNFVLDGYEPMGAYELLRDYIEYFHIKDALYAGAIVPAGLGEAKIAEIISRHRTLNAAVGITLEPHLETFSGLNALVGKKFENTYKYENQKAAFIDAFEHLRSIL